MSESMLKTRKIISGLLGRHENFTDGSFSECYVVPREKAVVLKAEAYAPADKETIKQLISEAIEKLRT